MKKIISIILLIFVTLVISGCSTQDIEEIKNSEYIDQKVTVKGTVQNTIKLGPISGFIIEDENKNSIAVSSQELPKEGENIIVKGVLKKDILIGYYIEKE